MAEQVWLAQHLVVVCQNIRLAHHLAEHLSRAKRDCERICLELATHFARVTGYCARKCCAQKLSLCEASLTPI